jgi:predicted Zn-dependent protease
MIERGDVARAADALKPYANDGTRPVMILQAQAALAGSSPDGAAVARNADTLNVWVTQHPADALAWTVLGQSWERLGQKLRAVRADAESHAANGDLPGAIDRFRAGQRMARGPGVAPSEFIEASVIDARLRDVEIANKQIEADEKKS